MALYPGGKFLANIYAGDNEHLVGFHVWFLATLLFASFLGHVLLLYASVRFLRLRLSPVYMMILGIFLGNLFSFLHFLLWTVADLRWEDEWALGDVACKIYRGSDSAEVGLIVLCLFVLALDRFVVTLFPKFGHTWLKPVWGLIILPSICLLATAHALFIALNSQVHPEGDNVCEMLWPESLKQMRPWRNKIEDYTILTTLFLYIVTLLVQVIRRFGCTHKCRSPENPYELGKLGSHVNTLVLWILTVGLLVPLPFYVLQELGLCVDCTETMWMEFLKHAPAILLPLLCVLISGDYRRGVKQTFCLRTSDAEEEPEFRMASFSRGPFPTSTFAEWERDDFCNIPGDQVLPLGLTSGNQDRI